MVTFLSTYSAFLLFSSCFGSSLHRHNRSELADLRTPHTCEDFYALAQKVDDLVSLLSSTKKGVYLGCWKDSSIRAVPNLNKNDARMTVDFCIDHCASRGYVYAAVQYSSQCFCGSSSAPYKKYGRGSGCNMTCNGNINQKCGGVWHNNVYYVAGLTANGFYRWQSSWYKFVLERVTWQQARLACIDYGGDLVTVDSLEENNYLSNYIRDNNICTGYQYWIGFNDIDVEGQFRWADGSNSEYQHWSSGEPNNSGNKEDCATMMCGSNHFGSWNDAPCDILTYFICEVKQE